MDIKTILSMTYNELINENSLYVNKNNIIQVDIGHDMF